MRDDMQGITQIGQIMSDPYADPGMKMVAQALIQRMMPEQMSPYQAGQLGDTMMDNQRDQSQFDQTFNQNQSQFDQTMEQRQAEQAAAQQSELGTYGTVQWANRPGPDGKPTLAPYVVGKQGDVKWLDLGEGAQPMPPTDNANLGTSMAQVGPGGAVVAQEPIDVAGEKAAATVGEAQGTAQTNVPMHRL
jgi:hypothetical protein